MKEKYPFNPSLIAVIHILYVIALAAGARSTRAGRLLSIPIFFLCIFMVFFCVSDDRVNTYHLSTGLIAVAFTTSDFILLRNYQPEICKIGQKKPTSEMSLPARLWWAASLDIATRGVGWTHEPTMHLPPRPALSRPRFIASQLMWLGIYFIQLDAVSIAIRAHPSYVATGPSFGASGWLWRTTVWVHIIAAYLSLSMVYATMSILSVAFRLSGPRDWPHLFDTPKKAYTLRNVWGRVWHQMVRKMFTTNAEFVAQTLRLQKGIFKKYFKLFLTFFFSGVMHYCGEYMLFQDWSGTALQFFLLQATAITFEDAIIAFAARLGFSQSTKLFKLIGYIWVFAWFTFSLPKWMDPVLRTGIFESGPMEISLISAMLWGDWTPKHTPIV